MLTDVTVRKDDSPVIKEMGTFSSSYDLIDLLNES